MSIDNHIPSRSPTPPSSHSHLRLDPAPPVEREASAALLPQEPTVSTPHVAITTNYTYPPIPAYSPYPSNDIPVIQTTPPEEGDVVDDLQRYAIAHDHAGTGVAPRLPESFPVDLFSLRSSQGPPETLPPYGANDPPGYSRRIENHPAEPETLAMHFFKFGFFFPAFWVFGALMLITPLRSPNPLSPVAQLSVWPPNSTFVAWCNEHVRTEEDKQEYLAKMQEVEMKWAKRCLLALGMLLCFAVAIGVTIFAVLKVKDLS